MTAFEAIAILIAIWLFSGLLSYFRSVPLAVRLTHSSELAARQRRLRRRTCRDIWVRVKIVAFKKTMRSLSVQPMNWRSLFERNLVFCAVGFWPIAVALAIFNFNAVPFSNHWSVWFTVLVCLTVLGTDWSQRQLVPDSLRLSPWSHVGLKVLIYGPAIVLLMNAAAGLAIRSSLPMWAFGVTQRTIAWILSVLLVLWFQPRSLGWHLLFAIGLATLAVFMSPLSPELDASLIAPAWVAFFWCWSLLMATVLRARSAWSHVAAVLGAAALAAWYLLLGHGVLSSATAQYMFPLMLMHSQILGLSLVVTCSQYGAISMMSRFLKCRGVWSHLLCAVLSLTVPIAAGFMLTVGLLSGADALVGVGLDGRFLTVSKPGLAADDWWERVSTAPLTTGGLFGLSAVVPFCCVGGHLLFVMLSNIVAQVVLKWMESVLAVANHVQEDLVPWSRAMAAAALLALPYAGVLYLLMVCTKFVSG